MPPFAWPTPYTPIPVMSESPESPAASPTIPILEPKFSPVLSTEPITAAPEKSAPDADAPAANTVSVPTEVMFGCAAVCYST